VSTSIERLDCSLLDARGQIFDSITRKSQPASAAQGLYCRAPGTYPLSHGRSPRMCPLADERNLYYGMLGPYARSLTYTEGGKTHTVATVGPDGAYLIVTPGTTHLFTGARGRLDRAGLADSDAVPVYSPITAIHYRGGATCHLVTAERWIYGRTACSPALPEPFGYVKHHMPSHAQLDTPIRARLVRGSKGQWEVIVAFTSRVAISSLRGEYELKHHEPGTPAQAYGVEWIEPGHDSRYDVMIPSSSNIAAGQSLTAMIDRFPLGPGLAAGIVSGEIILDYTNGPLMQAAEDTAKLPVASFKIRIP
jgi:hypothetical protein